MSFAVTSTVAALRLGSADVIMGTRPPIFQAVSVCLVAFCRQNPFLLEVRDLWPAFAIDMGVLKSPVLIAMSRWLERLPYPRAAHLIINSPAYRDYLIDKGVPPSKITVVPNGVDPSMFHPERRCQQVRDEYKLAEKFIITHAGALFG